MRSWTDWVQSRWLPRLLNGLYILSVQLVLQIPGRANGWSTLGDQQGQAGYHWSSSSRIKAISFHYPGLFLSSVEFLTCKTVLLCFSVMYVTLLIFPWSTLRCKYYAQPATAAGNSFTMSPFWKTKISVTLLSYMLSHWHSQMIQLHVYWWTKIISPS